MRSQVVTATDDAVAGTSLNSVTVGLLTGAVRRAKAIFLLMAAGKGRRGALAAFPR